MDAIFADEMPRSRVAVLLKHFSQLADGREPWWIVYPLAEVLLLLTCATIAGCDDFDDIVAWGEHHLDFLRRFSPFHHGIPCVRWLQTLVNRIDPELFGRCFESWIKELWPGRHDLIAIDDKTSRRTHDKRKGIKALHTLSAYATNARLVLTQLSVPEKTNEITAIPELLDHLAETKQLKGALVTIDAMGCQVAIADKIVGHKADYLLALKGNQPTLEAEVADYFRSAPAEKVVSKEAEIEKGHGRIEMRTYTASSEVDWIVSERSYPGEAQGDGATFTAASIALPEPSLPDKLREMYGNGDNGRYTSDRVIAANDALNEAGASNQPMRGGAHCDGDGGWPAGDGAVRGPGSTAAQRCRRGAAGRALGRQQVLCDLSEERRPIRYRSDCAVDDQRHSGARIVEGRRRAAGCGRGRKPRSYRVSGHP
jgi:predicted transposase YbfD/YdcC